MMELDVLTKAESPHIVEFFGAFHNQASVYLCLEYMDAGSIEHLYLTRGGLPEDVLAAVAFAVVSGMKFLYKELRIMHRDVKPSNILVNNRGEVKLCDFGISGYLVRSLARTHIGSMCYMAPERVSLEKPAEYTAKADVWSLGVTLYEAATCELLYSPKNYDSPFAQLMALLNEPAPTLPDTYSASFHHFVGCCLEKDPKQRASFDTLLAHEWLAGFADGQRKAEDIVKAWLDETPARSPDPARSSMRLVESTEDCF